MRKFYLLCVLAGLSVASLAQRPCGDSLHRQFDFWVGEWNVYSLQGRLAGHSHISLLLDSCIVLEEWTSANQINGVTYTGKSFNTYNARTGQWQQTWVDNMGGSTEFLLGARIADTLTFKTQPFQFTPDTVAIRRLRFIQLSNNRVRQWGEISKNEGKSWNTEYDLLYEKSEADPSAIFDSLLRKMEKAYLQKDFRSIISAIQGQVPLLVPVLR